MRAAWLAKAYLRLNRIPGISAPHHSPGPHLPSTHVVPLPPARDQLVDPESCVPGAEPAGWQDPAEPGWSLFPKGRLAPGSRLTCTP